MRPNPFREAGYVDRKIVTLKASITETHFWATVVARLDADGRPELAFGHHRVKAAQELYGPDGEIPLNIAQLSDEQMLRMLVREYMEEWQTSALADQAALRAVIKAYAEGRVSLPTPHPKTPAARIRYAPSYRQGHVAGGHRQERPYTAGTLVASGLLGCDKDKVEDVLSALELIEMGVTDKDEYQDLTPNQARFLTRTVRGAIQSYQSWANDFDHEARQAQRAKDDDLSALAQEQAAATRAQAQVVGQCVTRRLWAVLHEDQLRKASQSLDRLLAPKRDRPRHDCYEEDVALLLDGRDSRQRANPGESRKDPAAVDAYFKHIVMFGAAIKIGIANAHRFAPEHRHLVLGAHEKLRTRIAELEAAFSGAPTPVDETWVIDKDFVYRIAPGLSWQAAAAAPLVQKWPRLRGDACTLP